jgi:hypothetical protein
MQQAIQGRPPAKHAGYEENARWALDILSSPQQNIAKSGKHTFPRKS